MGCAKENEDDVGGVSLSFKSATMRRQWSDNSLGVCHGGGGSLECRA
jgi:hypothetical protein